MMMIVKTMVVKAEMVKRHLIEIMRVLGCRSHASAVDHTFSKSIGGYKKA
jgi:hypothetical protein